MSIKSGIKNAEREAEQRRQRELEEKKIKAKQDCERRIIEEQKRRLELEVIWPFILGRALYLKWNKKSSS